MLNKKILVSLAIAASATLAACSSTPTTDTTSTQTPTTSSGGPGTQAYGSGGATGSGADSSLASISQHTVYFDFDSSELKPESASVVTAWSKYLTAHPTSKIRVEGNTDERGTREYNVALGERRANAVATALEAQGVSAAQLSIVSYGEEHPVALGHDEDSWAQNRRVDLTQ